MPGAPSPRATPWRSPPALDRAAGRSGRARSPRRAAAAAAAGPYSWATIAARTIALYDELLTARAIIADLAVLEIVFWASVGLLVYTHVGYPLLLLALSRAERSPRRRAGIGRGAVGVADRRRPRRGRRDRPLGRDGARPRLSARAAGGGRRLRRLHRRAPPSALARPARTGCWSWSAGGKVAALNAARGRGTGGAVLAFSDANSVWRPDALRRLVGPPRHRRRRLRLRPGALPRPRRRRQRGGPLLALRDGRPRDGVEPGRDHRRQRGHQRGSP